MAKKGNSMDGVWKNTKKEKGYRAEKIVADWYESRGYGVSCMNFTIRGWEIDIIVEKGRERRFVEVKCVDYIDMLAGYITDGKRRALGKTVAVYNYRNPTQKNIAIDVVFVRNNHIVQIFENITF